jgi:murein DD-endopeptidase MepM/ murein hydrolase activator NlpD
MFKLAPPDRGTDGYGSGHYGAPRGNHRHKGIDKLAVPGSRLYAVSAGKVTKLGYAYSDDLSYRYVQVSDAFGRDIRYFYIEPLVEVGDLVDETTVLGTVQDLTPRYPGIGNHFHFEVRLDGEYLNPNDFLRCLILSQCAVR